jgi:hypothetical protein
VADPSATSFFLLNNGLLIFQYPLRSDCETRARASASGVKSNTVAGSIRKCMRAAADGRPGVATIEFNVRMPIGAHRATWATKVAYAHTLTLVTQLKIFDMKDGKRDNS